VLRVLRRAVTDATSCNLEGEQVLHRLQCFTIGIAAALAPLGLLESNYAHGNPPGDRTRADGDTALAHAREMRAAGQAGYGDAYRLAAATFSWAGLPMEAVAVVEELLTEPGSDFDRFGAMRMKSQYLLAAGRQEEAWGAASEALALVDAQPELKRFNASYLTVIYIAANCRTLANDTAGELALVERIAVTDRSRFDLDVVASAMVRKASLQEHRGDREGAIETTQELLDTNPTWGVQDGRRMNVELNQLTRRFTDPVDPGLAAGLAGIWNAPGNRSLEGVLYVGHELRQALASSGNTAGAVAVAREMVDLIDANKAGWIAESGDSARTVASLWQFEVENLEYLAWSAPEGLQTHTPWALGRLIERATNPGRRQLLFIRLLRVTGTP